MSKGRKIDPAKAKAAARHAEPAAEPAAAEPGEGVAGAAAPGSAAAREAGEQDAMVAAAAAADPEQGEREALRRERDEFQEKWLRALAELDNVRKRARREVQDARRLAQADLLRPILEVRDNLMRALQSFAAADAEGGAEGIRQGVELILQKFETVLRDGGVTAIAAKGRPFDPAFHEAVALLAQPDTEPGLVIEVVQEGFMLNEMVLRPARVVISQ